VPYAYRSFDRQWVLPDARVGDYMRPALWRILGPRQVFLTSLLTNVLGSGPAAVATTLVADLDHFRGSFGARAVIPLWCDAAATRPNVHSAWLAKLSDAYAARVGAEAVFAYCYALLATPGYVARFADELRIPGPRVPLTRGADLFQRTAALGERLLAVHTYQHVPTGAARCVAPIGDAYPRGYRYDVSAETLHVGDGSIGPVTRRVWDYCVSGMRVVPSWLARRITRKKRLSPLDAIMPRAWTAAMTRELLELLWLLEATLMLEPALDAVLDEVVSGSCFHDALPGGLAEQFSDRLSAQRPREDKALPQVAAELVEQIPL
jgi:hypothetical protein